jgi:hypothetical protein
MKTLEQVFVHILRDRVSVNYIGVQTELGDIGVSPKKTHATGTGTLELARLHEFETALRERGFRRAPEEAFEGTLYVWTRESAPLQLENNVK